MRKTPTALQLAASDWQNPWCVTWGMHYNNRVPQEGRQRLPKRQHQLSLQS